MADYTLEVPGFPIIPPGPAPNADTFEEDGSYATAKTIALDATQTHTIHTATDEDYVTFTLGAATDVRISTSGGDTQMWLVSSALPATLYNDDAPGGGSAITATLPAGTYYILICQFQQQQTIDSYTLHLEDLTIGFPPVPDPPA